MPTSIHDTTIGCKKTTKELFIAIKKKLNISTNDKMMKKLLTCIVLNENYKTEFDKETIEQINKINDNDFKVVIK